MASIKGVTMFLLAAALQTGPVQLPSYDARHTVDAVRVDGTLDEKSWTQAPRMRPFRHIHDPARVLKFPTEAAIVWDDVHLYVAFDCTDAEPWGRMTRRDDRLWEEEVVEVFLDPDGDGLNYAELEVSPDNVVVDLLIPRPKSNTAEALRWNIDGLQTAVGRHPGGWRAEIAIPWKSLAAAGASSAPAVGGVWRAGLYRIKRPGGPAKADEIARLTAELASVGGERPELKRRLQELSANDEFQAWSVTRSERGFHDPERFGTLRFVR